MREVKKDHHRLGLRLMALVIFLALLIYLSVHYTPQITELLARRHELKQYVEAHGLTGILFFILLQIFQVVIAAVPGEIVQVAGGYFYGPFWGTVYLVIGVIIGSTFNFQAARLLGWEIIRKTLPRKVLEKASLLLKEPKSELTIFLLFLIPGLPKDALTYLAGLTPVRMTRFLVIAVTGRLPALVVSTFFGAGLQQENPATIITALAVTVLLFLSSLLLKNKLNRTSQ